jgi:syndecan 1
MTADHGDNAGPGAGPGRFQHHSDSENRFDIVVRGYDRRQVDEHLANLERTIARQRTDIEQARNHRGDERARAFNAGTGAGRPGDGGGQAGGPGGLTPEMIGAFTTRLQSILQAAEDEAEEVRANARNAVRAEEEASRARLGDMERRREGVVRDLTRVRSQLDGLLSQVASDSGAAKAASAGPKSPQPVAQAPKTPPGGNSMQRGDKAPAGARPEHGGPGGPGGRPDQGRQEPAGRPDQGGRPEQMARPEPMPRAAEAGSRLENAPRGGPLPVADNTRKPSPRPEEAARPAPRPSPAPAQGGSVPAGSSSASTPQNQSNGAPAAAGSSPPAGQAGTPHSGAPSPKPRPSPSPRPRPTPAAAPAQSAAPAQGAGQPAGTRQAEQQPARNGAVNRESSSGQGREDDGGRSAFGTGAR